MCETVRRAWNIFKPHPVLFYLNLKNTQMIFFLQEMQQVFEKIDTDKSGSLSLEEVVLYLKSITDDISEDNIEKIFEGIDTSGDKVVDFEEFKVKLKQKQNILIEMGNVLGGHGSPDRQRLEQAEQPGGGEGGGGAGAVQHDRQGRQRGTLSGGGEEGLQAHPGQVQHLRGE